MLYSLLSFLGSLKKLSIHFRGDLLQLHRNGVRSPDLIVVGWLVLCRVACEVRGSGAKQRLQACVPKAPGGRVKRGRWLLTETTALTEPHWLLTETIDQDQLLFKKVFFQQLYIVLLQHTNSCNDQCFPTSFDP